MKTTEQILTECMEQSRDLTEAEDKAVMTGILKKLTPLEQIFLTWKFLEQRGAKQWSAADFEKAVNKFMGERK